jgi:hypothetical protein
MKDFTCDKCEQDIDIHDLALLGSSSSECNPFMKMITLCWGCIYDHLESLTRQIPQMPMGRVSDTPWLMKNIHHWHDHEVYPEIVLVLQAIHKKKTI